MALNQSLGCVLVFITFCYAHLQNSYSKLQYGHRLDRRIINSFVLDCAEECLRTTRCRSVNHHEGTNYCEINYGNKFTSSDRYIEDPYWIYSEREDRDIVGIVFSNWDIHVWNCSYRHGTRFGVLGFLSFG
jgi:hypothetical protein